MAWNSVWVAPAPSAPRVNLLPREIHERRLVRRQRAGIGAALAAVLVLLGLWYALELRQLDDARKDADRQRAVAASLRARQAQLQPLADLQAQLAATAELRAQVYAHEIRFSGVMQDLAAIVPGNVWLTEMSVGLKDAGTPSPPTTSGSSGRAQQAAAAPGSPGAGGPVASITFSGIGLGHVDVGGFMRALAKGPTRDGDRVYLNPYFTSSQKAGSAGGPATVNFSASVDLSSAAYSGRYQPGGRTP
jgi:Tfp pilus assembly protein PilN